MGSWFLIKKPKIHIEKEKQDNQNYNAGSNWMVALSMDQQQDPQLSRCTQKKFQHKARQTESSKRESEE